MVSVIMLFDFYLLASLLLLLLFSFQLFVVYSSLSIYSRIMTKPNYLFIVFFAFSVKFVVTFRLLILG